MLTLGVHLEIEMESQWPTSIVMMVQPQSGDGQVILTNELIIVPQTATREYIDLQGNRCLRLSLPAGRIRIESRIVASVPASFDIDPTAAFHPMEDLPDQVLPFVLPSRYCESDALEEMAQDISGAATPGYAQVELIRDWINKTFIYEYGASDSHTSAKDALRSRKGVCRDFAHVGIALTRGLNIPARMVVGYLDGLEPMDMHAWYEAFVGGRWYTFDATQREPKGGRIIVATGRDAADVAIATYFSEIKMHRLHVRMQRLPEIPGGPGTGQPSA